MHLKYAGLCSGVRGTRGQDPRGGGVGGRKELEAGLSRFTCSCFYLGWAGAGSSPGEGRAAEPLSRQCW